MKASDILLLATIHDTHRENPNYSFEVLFNAVDAHHPDLILVEMRQQDMHESCDYLYEYYPPEMVMAKEKYGKRIQVLGFDWRGHFLADKPIHVKDESLKKLWEVADEHPEVKAKIRHIKALMEPFFSTCTLETCQGAYETLKENELDEDLSQWLALNGFGEINTYYDERDSHIQKNVLEQILAHPDQRVVILTGRSHRAPLAKFLEEALHVSGI